MSDAGAVPSRLPDLLRYAIALLVQAGIADFPHVDGSGLVEILIGERHEMEEGAGRRIFFVPGDGGIGGALEISSNQIGARSQGCEAYVWGLEGDGNLGRYDDADVILEQLWDALHTGAAARLGALSEATVKRVKPTDINTFGEEYRVEFSYVWAVPRLAAIQQAARALALMSKSPPDPDRPAGPIVSSFHQTVINANERTG
jgi:hypothetical protein